MNEEVYNYLCEQFGVDSQCNSLYPCKNCLIDTELLNQRRYYEKNDFFKLFESTKHIKETHMYCIVYALSSNWYKEWEQFVQGKSKGISLF